MKQSVYRHLGGSLSATVKSPGCEEWTAEFQKPWIRESRKIRHAHFCFLFLRYFYFLFGFFFSRTGARNVLKYWPRLAKGKARQVR